METSIIVSLSLSGAALLVSAFAAIGRWANVYVSQKSLRLHQLSNLHDLRFHDKMLDAKEFISNKLRNYEHNKSKFKSIGETLSHTPYKERKTHIWYFIQYFRRVKYLIDAGLFKEDEIDPLFATKSDFYLLFCFVEPLEKEVHQGLVEGGSVKQEDWDRGINMFSFFRDYCQKKYGDLECG